MAFAEEAGRAIQREPAAETDRMVSGMHGFHAGDDLAGGVAHIDMTGKILDAGQIGASSGTIEHLELAVLVLFLDFARFLGPAAALAIVDKGQRRLQGAGIELVDMHCQTPLVFPRVKESGCESAYLYTGRRVFYKPPPNHAAHPW